MGARASRRRIYLSFPHVVENMEAMRMVNPILTEGIARGGIERAGRKACNISRDGCPIFFF